MCMKNVGPVIVGIIIGIVICVGSFMVPGVQQKMAQSMGQQMLIEIESPLNFDDTLIKLEENLEILLLMILKGVF